ncbi:MAG: HNH endonuclease [Saprospiraceae bacterium]|nr:MAG: HNH endonuclease [Saprospiraceae bacterium]
MPKFSSLPDIRLQVAARAKHCCEYCKSMDIFSPNYFTVDHIIPEPFGGPDSLSNLAYACFLGNRLKSNKSSVFDVASASWVKIYNPRALDWNEHFAWSEDLTLILGISVIGRVTVDELQLNRPKLVAYRKAVIPFGVHPPG